MAKKEHNYVQSGTGQTTEKPQQIQHTLQQAKPVGNAAAYRTVAVILWVAALACEIVALLLVRRTVVYKLQLNTVTLIVLIVIDLILVVIGSQLWKKANHIKPASEKNPTLFWIWNNMGVIVALICFVPLIVIILTDKNMDKKTKTITAVVAIVALLIGSVSGVDFNPVSQEQQQAAMEELGETQVFWAPYGRVYHTHDDCGALNNTENLTYGTVEQAIAEGRTRLCSFCAKRDEITDIPIEEPVE